MLVCILVQFQILDRKNAEIEELKVHYRNKLREQEENMTKTEKKGK